MLGSRTIGDRFVGAGRSVLKPPIPIEAAGFGQGQGVALPEGSLGIAASGSGQGQGATNVTFTVPVVAAGQGAGTSSPDIKGIFVLPAAGQGAGTGVSQVDARKPLQSDLNGAGIGVAGLGKNIPLESAGAGVGGGLSNIGNIQPVLADGQGAGFSEPSLGATLDLSAPGTGIGEGTARFGLDLSVTTISGRIIFIPPKFPNLPVPVKNRIIRIRTDDTGLAMAERTKQPGETVDYVLDMIEWFEEVDTGDYLDIPECSVVATPTGDPNDLEIGPGAFPEIEGIGLEPQQARVWVAGGRDGVEYKVTVTLTTNQGRVEEFDLLLFVEDL